MVIPPHAIAFAFIGIVFLCLSALVLAVECPRISPQPGEVWSCLSTTDDPFKRDDTTVIRIMATSDGYVQFRYVFGGKESDRNQSMKVSTMQSLGYRKIQVVEEVQ